MEHAKLEKYNTIVKGEFVQTKHQLKKLYILAVKRLKKKYMYKDIVMIRMDLNSFLENPPRNLLREKNLILLK